MNNTQRKNERIAFVYSRLNKMGFNTQEVTTLLRIEKTLGRWAGKECGNGNDFASWHIERDEVSQVPYLVTIPNRGGATRKTKIADKEKGALDRLGKMMETRPNLLAYHQTDPRGCSLYIVEKDAIKQGEKVDCVYNRGMAVVI